MSKEGEFADCSLKWQKNSWNKKMGHRWVFTFSAVLHSPSNMLPQSWGFLSICVQFKFQKPPDGNCKSLHSAISIFTPQQSPEGSCRPCERQNLAAHRLPRSSPSCSPGTPWCNHCSSFSLFVDWIKNLHIRLSFCAALRRPTYFWVHRLKSLVTCLQRLFFSASPPITVPTNSRQIKTAFILKSEKVKVFLTFGNKIENSKPLSLKCIATSAKYKSVCPHFCIISYHPLSFQYQHLLKVLQKRWNQIEVLCNISYSNFLHLHTKCQVGAWDPSE